MTAVAAFVPHSTAAVPGVVADWTRGAGELASAERDAPGVSVVLCTYRRAASVQRFLQSLGRQARLPDETLIVDASPDEATETIVRAWPAPTVVRYWRVEPPLRGLTRQRNFGLDRVTRDLVAFFDDDVVLGAECLAELERAHRERPALAGAGCFAESWMQPTALWRLRRALGIVPNLQPGTYTRTGLSIPWRFHAPTTAVVEGDWLPGCAMMLKTAAARVVRFEEVLAGYGQGEDLEFSLRLRARGAVALVGAAACDHLHEPAGRPDAFRLGRMEIENRHLIWRRTYRNLAWRDRLAFAYAWTLDTLLLARDAMRPGRAADGLRRIAGRVRGGAAILARRQARV
ncbi:MAG: glycosyltransferase family 2 protein [Acidobacteria bacterium]|nr:glycosyltransferase family 2 protein [Acidobacteriota bacterium]